MSDLDKVVISPCTQDGKLIALDVTFAGCTGLRATLSASAARELFDVLGQFFSVEDWTKYDPQGALGRRCTTCGAPIGQGCQNRGEPPLQYFHASRLSRE